MEIVRYEKREHIAVITLNRPDKWNAVNEQMNLEMAEAWTRYEEDEDAWVAIITGEGKAFCAGNDLKEGMRDGKVASDFAEVPIIDPYWMDTFQKPVIAAINGPALGGGFFLALRADFRIAAQEAIFQIAEINFGLPVGIYPQEHWLIRENLPYVVMTEMLSGMKLTAQRAYEIGFVNYVVPKEQLMAKAFELAGRIISVPPKGSYYNLKLLRDLRRMNAKLPGDLQEKGESYREEMVASKDSQEALAAFLERRKPIFTRR